MWLFVLITLVVGYLLGNLNGAVCVSKLMGDDVRSHGSGNAGLTNFIRNYGAGSSLTVILIDAGKAVAACVIGGLLLLPYTSAANAAFYRDIVRPLAGEEHAIYLQETILNE